MKIERVGHTFHAVYPSIADPLLNLNATDSWGRTPLTVAAQLNHTLIIECLLDHGAEPNKPDELLGMYIQFILINC